MRARPKLLWRGLQPLLSRMLTPSGRSMAATAMSVTHMEVMVPMAMKASTMRSVRRPTLVSIHSMKRRARPEDVMAAERPMAPMRNSSTLLPKPNVTSLSKLATPKICRNTIRQRDVAGKGMASVIHWMTAKQRTAITILAFAVSGMASSPL